MKEKHCKWYNDEFCTNDKSPCVADYCPVVEYPELCKHREFDKDINVRGKDDEEKKLATMICIVCGKEIDKNYARNTIGNYCKTCAFDRALMLQIDKDYASGAMDENIIFDVEKALENNQDAGCYVGDLLRIIQRLQSEKAEYERKLANGDIVPVKELVDKGELCSMDYHNEQMHVLNCEIETYKAEIERLNLAVEGLTAENKVVHKENDELIEKVERLTEEKWNVQDDLDNYHIENVELITMNAELQKRVDELTEERENMQAEIMRFEDMKFTQEHCDLYKENEWLKASLQQVVKDTAKEIYEIAVDYYDGKDIDGAWFFGALKEHYGVEVE